MPEPWHAEGKYRVVPVEAQGQVLQRRSPRSSDLFKPAPRVHIWRLEGSLLQYFCLVPYVCTAHQSNNNYMPDTVSKLLPCIIQLFWPTIHETALTFRWSTYLCSNRRWDWLYMCRLTCRHSGQIKGTSMQILELCDVAQCQYPPDIGIVLHHMVPLYPINNKMLFMLLWYTIVQIRTQGYCITNQYYLYLKAGASYSKSSTLNNSQLDLKRNPFDKHTNSS